MVPAGGRDGEKGFDGGGGQKEGVRTIGAGWGIWRELAQALGAGKNRWGRENEGGGMGEGAGICVL